MRGSVVDIMFLMIFIGIIGIILFTASNLVTNLSGTELMTSDVESDVTSAYQLIDNNAVFMFIGVGLAVALMALTIKVHPIFIVPALLSIMVKVMASGMVSYIFLGVATDSSLVTEADKYPNMVYQIAYIPYIIVAISFIMLIALYAKPGGGR